MPVFPHILQSWLLYLDIYCLPLPLSNHSGVLTAQSQSTPGELMNLAMRVTHSFIICEIHCIILSRRKVFQQHLHASYQSLACVIKQLPAHCCTRHLVCTTAREGGITKPFHDSPHQHPLFAILLDHTATQSFGNASLL